MLMLVVMTLNLTLIFENVCKACPFLFFCFCFFFFRLFFSFRLHGQPSFLTVYTPVLSTCRLFQTLKLTKGEAIPPLTLSPPLPSPPIHSTPLPKQAKSYNRKKTPPKKTTHTQNTLCASSDGSNLGCCKLTQS